ncbi:FAD-dependent monooxygenase [Streptomyces sp. NPDC053431]|uniref:FAD-dependent monooxygenase n=1 Tax=Streptomyces sp. NPDC053431 TaxID=3365703 RepID=UPI0037D2E3D4
MFHERTTVLVVGGGPVGLLLAGELALQNVDTLVLEQHERVRDSPRAGTLHARSVQSLLRRGVLRLPVPGRLDLRQRTGFHFAGLPLLTISSPTAEGPPIFHQPQSSLEQAFEVRARSLGADVRRGSVVRRLTEHADRVEAEVLAADGAVRVLVADWVVGCDGARSTVREHAGFPVTTTEPSFSGVIGLVRLTDPADAPGGWARGPEGSTLINVNPRGHSRVLTHDFTRPFPDRRRPVTLEELSATAARVLGRALPMRDLVYGSRFSDFTRVADSYRSPGHGRVLLAGDAAHVHAPLGGQGLNTGLQDAFNLGWKLGLVARGDAPATLLDTYTDERRAVALTVVANTRAQAALMDPRPQQEPLRAHFGRLMEVPEARAATAEEISGQSIRHPRPGTDPLTGTFLPNHTFLTREGPRSTAELLEDATPLLLLAEDVTAVPEELLDGWPPDRLRTVRVGPADADGTALGWRAVLCRPDGYLAWAAGDTEPDPAELAGELARWLGPARSPAGVRQG